MTDLEELFIRFLNQPWTGQIYFPFLHAVSLDGIPDYRIRLGPMHKLTKEEFDLLVSVLSQEQKAKAIDWHYFNWGRKYDEHIQSYFRTN